MRLLLPILLWLPGASFYAYEEITEPQPAPLPPGCDYAAEHGLALVQYLCCEEICAPLIPERAPNIMRGYYVCTCGTEQR